MEQNERDLLEILRKRSVDNKIQVGQLHKQVVSLYKQILHPKVESRVKVSAAQAAAAAISGEVTLVTAVLAYALPSTTYYFGSKAGLEPKDVAILAPIYVTKAGTIQIAYVHWQDNSFAGGIAGTGEAVSLYIRLNNTTDTLINTISSVDSNKLFINTGLSIVVAQGDYFEIKVVTPAWVTCPVDLALGGSVFIG